MGWWNLEGRVRKLVFKERLDLRMGLNLVKRRSPSYINIRLNLMTPFMGLRLKSEKFFRTHSSCVVRGLRTWRSSFAVLQWPN